MVWDAKAVWLHLYLVGIQQQRHVEGVIVFFVLNFSRVFHAATKCIEMNWHRGNAA